MSVRITWPDGASKDYEQGITVEQLAASLSASLRKRAVGGKLNGKLVDLSTSVLEDAELHILTPDMPEGLNIYRHSAAHLMGQAIKRLYGGDKVKLAIGPVIEDGFYYDMELEQPLTLDDLPLIEQEMQRIVAENLPISRRDVSRDGALKLFADQKNPYKVEILQQLTEDSVISMYEQGEFVDLCRGPHLPSTGIIKAFKLLNVAGAYWRGDSSNKMLQRVYGTAFVKQAELDEHLHMLEEARKRDHRKLGKELELFMFSEEAPGMPFYLPNGMTLRNQLELFSREVQLEQHYDEVRTPLMMNQELWEQSGHWDHYKDNMYFTEVDNHRFALKPMNCPGHMLIYKNRLRSYRDLPIRLAEFGQVHRHEFSGALNGMMRVRTFCQDDAHLFVRPDQIEAEIGKIIDMIGRMYAVFGFTYSIELSTRPEDYMGGAELWDKAEQSLQQVLDNRGVRYGVNEGDGAFYGPKIDFHITDALKRSWQCATIQLDFQMPEKFELTYIGEDNQKHRPVVIHRAIYGSIDRFIGILTEHYGGHFPLWLAPVQVKLLPVSSNNHAYAAELEALLRAKGIRVAVDAREEKLGYKIREAGLAKVPYALIIGDKELEGRSLSVRARGGIDMGSMPVDQFIAMVTQQAADKT
jgi:threonyl-tRNA synthetase